MRILLLLIFLLVVNCKLNKIVDSHGTHYLEKKEKKLTINLSNKNDIINLLGPPSTKSKFDNDLWIYIERKKTRTTLLRAPIRATPSTHTRNTIRRRHDSRTTNGSGTCNPNHDLSIATNETVRLIPQFPISCTAVPGQ